MAKRKILAIIIALAVVLSVSLCACSSEIKTTESDDANDISYSEKITVSSGGSYYLFRTASPENYVDFLENLDKEKYEIIDITIQAATYHRDDCFLITYTEKTEAQ